MKNTTKISEKTIKTADAAYLYAAGKLVIVHEITHPKLGRSRYVTLHDVPKQTGFSGRIILHSRGAVRLAVFAFARTNMAVTASVASRENGSENTKTKDIAVGHVSFYLGPRYSDAVTFYEMPGLLSGNFTYQPDVAWAEPEPFLGRWSDYPIAAA